jgi:phage-related protein
MAQFPVLATGAAAQYPARYTTCFRADVIRFFDGSEQRFRNSPGLLHQWVIALSQLSEQEMNAIEEFFLQNQGAAGTFAFTDPRSGQVYPNCSLVSDELGETSVGVLSGRVSVTIRENRT